MCVLGSKCALGAGKPHILTVLRYRGRTARYRGMTARYRSMVPRYHGTVARCGRRVPRRANGPTFVPSELRTVPWNHPTVPWNHSTVPCEDCSVPRNHRSVPRNRCQKCPVCPAMRLFRCHVPRGCAAACLGIPFAWPGMGGLGVEDSSLITFSPAGCTERQQMRGFSQRAKTLHAHAMFCLPAPDCAHLLPDTTQRTGRPGRAVADEVNFTPHEPHGDPG
jgi:hypothetical protein